MFFSSVPSSIKYIPLIDVPGETPTLPVETMDFSPENEMDVSAKTEKSLHFPSMFFGVNELEADAEADRKLEPVTRLVEEADTEVGESSDEAN